MSGKVDKITNEYAKRVSEVNNVEAVVFGETAKIETYDPSFIIDLDVYYEGELMSPSERCNLLGNPDIFESSPVYPVDRFLIDQLPVIINYRELSTIDIIFRRIEKAEWALRTENTNILYRLKEGIVLYNKSGWIDGIKNRFSNIPEEFWQNMLDSCRFLIEHYLREINVSAYKNNSLLYQKTFFHFLQSILGYICTVNKKFEPSPRVFYNFIKTLKKIPDEFLSRFDVLINPNPDEEFPLDRKGEIATLLAKSLIQMRLE